MLQMYFYLLSFDGLSKHPTFNTSKSSFTDAVEGCSVTVEIKAAFIQCQKQLHILTPSLESQLFPFMGKVT